MATEPLYVLVHGAWGSPEMWDHVIAALPAEADVVVADLPTCNGPGTTLVDDAAHVRELAGERRCILVGHSYGGAVITEAGASIPNAEHLVYLAACIPDVGESMLDWVMKRPSPSAMPMDFADDGTSVLVLDGYEMPYDELTNERMAAARLRRFSMAGLITPASSAAWRSIPSTAVVATEDTTILPETLREMAVRATTTIEVDDEHQLIFSRPDWVADLLVRVAAP